MKVLVTGGAGFIGSNFTKMTLENRFQGIDSIRVLDKFTYSGLHSNLEPLMDSEKLEVLIGDIADPIKVAKACDGVDAVINFAAESHVDRSILNAAEFIRTNIDGVRVLLEECKKRDIRFLQVSTDEVYGTIPQGSWDEKCPLEPNSPYSASKAAGDLLVRSFHKTYNSNTVITRCSNNYGPNQFPEKIIPFFITRLLEDKNVPLYGDGQNIRDWLHVSDHCYGIALALVNGISGETYNFGGGEELSNLQLTRLILTELGCGEVRIEFVEDRKGHDFRYSVDWSKAKRELGYSPKTDFAKGIVETINWYKKSEYWWRPLQQ